MKKAPLRDLVTAGKPPLARWNPYNSNCPTRLVLERIADKWTLLILGLLGGGPMRFGRLRATIDGVSQKVLSETLKRLERDGLVSRQAFATVPVTVEYSITPLGRSLASVANQLTAWAEANIEEVLAAQQRYGENEKS